MLKLLKTNSLRRLIYTDTLVEQKRKSNKADYLKNRHYFCIQKAVRLKHNPTVFLADSTFSILGDQGNMPHNDNDYDLICDWLSYSLHFTQDKINTV